MTPPQQYTKTTGTRQTIKQSHPRVIKSQHKHTSSTRVMSLKTTWMSTRREIFQKNPRAHKNKIGTPPPPPQNPKYPPPQNEEFYGYRFSCRKNAFFPGVHKIGAAICGARIADTNFTDTRIFLNLHSVTNPSSPFANVCQRPQTVPNSSRRIRWYAGRGLPEGRTGGVASATLSSSCKNHACQRNTPSEI